MMETYSMFIAVRCLVVSISVTYSIWLPDMKNVFDNDPLLMHVLTSTLLHICLPFAIICFITTELTGNIGQVDKVWSIIPTLTCWYTTFLHWQWNGFNEVNVKYVVMSSLVTVWAVKMLRGLYARGGVHFPCFWRGTDDYRWEAVRNQLPSLIKTNRFLFACFNFGFLCVSQIFLLWAMSGMVFIAVLAKDRLKNSKGKSDVLECLPGVLFIAWFVCETIADRQQQTYQEHKLKWNIKTKSNTSLYNDLLDTESSKLKNCTMRCEATDSDDFHYKLGFYMKGLFAYSRHPNFLAEQSIWISFYLFSVDFHQVGRNGIQGMFQVGGIMNSSICGCLLVVLLFKISTDLTEEISSSKYKGYKLYQQHVPRLFNAVDLLRRLFLGEVPNQDWKKDLE